jgi:hypothetical protein
MRKLAILSALLWLAVVASTVHAVDDGTVPSNLPAVPGAYSPAASVLVEAWNDNGGPGSTATYASTCFAFAYTPSVSYVLERIDWYAGDVPGMVSTTVRSGGLNGPTLGTVTYNEAPPRDWQGANLVPPVPVTAGITYYIVYDVVTGASISATTFGTIISHWHDPNPTCSAWNGPFDSQFWRARFYGTITTPVDGVTWGNIKSIYQ